jgi:CheY-like chemotaxis protein
MQFEPRKVSTELVRAVRYRRSRLPPVCRAGYRNSAAKVPMPIYQDSGPDWRKVAARRVSSGAFRMADGAIHHEPSLGAHQLRPLTVLIVEDQSLIRITTAAFLRDDGFNVLEAQSGAEAIVIFEINKTDIDLVFSDIVMPGLTDGLWLAQWVGNNRPTIPVILTSDSHKAGLAKEKCGGSLFIAKPYDVRHVAERIRSVVKAGKALPN